MPKSVLELDPTRAMEIHDIDYAGAMELAGIIKARHGGGESGPEALRAMLDELVEAGFVPIANPSHSAH
ncbi:hypothetical protein ACH79_40275 [Bradyrhizobium sp. CCBAU 051011]|uniref:hypothetical protein n=1 Tax=Bradyrhizobium sp. CCBAU 051011 TaxID=858422 RepID=UPI001373C7A7|nr:hypothetical protein [Bradyrhizobium sp. CCBAU 051011]QHO77904.1 hypothetical protein ACH79_40275 [Bradyrhizobium sp. CCBAU 051011]